MGLIVVTAVKIQVEILCVVTPCGVAVGYQRFVDSVSSGL